MRASGTQIVQYDYDYDYDYDYEKDLIRHIILRKKKRSAGILKFNDLWCKQSC